MKWLTRTKIGFTTAISSILLLILTLGAFTLFTQYMLYQRIENDLIQEAEEILSQHISLDGSRIVFVESDTILTLEQDLVTDHLSARILNIEGQSVGSFGIFARGTVTKGEAETLREYAATACVQKELQLQRNIEISQQRFATVFYPIMNNNNCFGTIIVSAATDSIAELRLLLLQLSLAVLALSVIVSGIAGRVAASLVLRPITKLAQLMRQLSLDQTPRKAPEPNVPSQDPIAELVSTFNSMSEQIYEGAQKQRGFIMNASHELRTPLARAVSNLDLALAEIQSTRHRHIEKLLSDTQQELLGISEIVEVLLHAARLKSTELARTSVQLASVVTQELSKFSADLQAKKLIIQNELTDETALINEQLLSLVVRNCLSNAVKYSPRSGTIIISARKQTPVLELCFCNSIAAKEAMHHPQSHKLGAVILDTLAELGQFRYTAKTTANRYRVSIENLQVTQ